MSFPYTSESTGSTNANAPTVVAGAFVLVVERPERSGRGYLWEDLVRALPLELPVRPALAGTSEPLAVNAGFRGRLGIGRVQGNTKRRFHRAQKESGERYKVRLQLPPAQVQSSRHCDIISTAC